MPGFRPPAKSATTTRKFKRTRSQRLCAGAEGRPGELFRRPRGAKRQSRDRRERNQTLRNMRIAVTARKAANTRLSASTFSRCASRAPSGADSTVVGTIKTKAISEI